MTQGNRESSLRQRLESLHWAVAAGAWEVDYRQGVYYLAESIQRLLGDPPGYQPSFEDLQAMTRVHPEDRPLLRAAMEEAVAKHSSTVEDCEFRLRHRDGQWIWLHTQSHILDWNDDGTPARIAGWHTDITERRRLESAMADTSLEVERLTGKEFFSALACSLSRALNVRYCVIGRLLPGDRVATVAFSDHGVLQPDFEYDLAGSPCEDVVRGHICVFPNSVADRFPADKALRKLHAESYMGMALAASEGSHCGLIALMDDKPMPLFGMARSLLPLFGARATAELERLFAEESLRASQQQYRLLFEHLISACALLDPVADESGKIVDFKYLEVNPAFYSMTRSTAAQVLGNTIRGLIPNVEDHWIEGMALVARTGHPIQFEQYSQDFNRWYELRAFQPEPGRVAILFNDITERRNTETGLRESERTLREMFENTLLAALLLDLDGRVTFCNEALLALVGRPADQVTGRVWFEHFVPEDERKEIYDHLESSGGDWNCFPRHWRNHVVHVSGSRRLIEWDNSPVYDAGGNLSGMAGLGRDLSAWEELEEQYRQAQKMEAIGRLAGGIAHDFNNLLTVINGYSGLALARLEERHEARHSIEEIQRAGDRAATLTRQLLAFSRKQFFKLRVLNMNDVVSDALAMLSRLMGAQIRIEAELEEAPRMVRADPGQMLQVLMNLAVNARDAIREHGRILLRTYNHTISAEGDPMFPSLAPGQFLALMVADDGSGMDEETQRHLFEPFFTTKPAGEGTGLGLATVYGIIRQSGGAIAVRSRVGEGTVFRILLPAVAGAPDQVRDLSSSAADQPEGSILLVEDQESVRNFLRTVLEESGFRVSTAPDGEKALDLLRLGIKPDLLLSDIVMPGLSGPGLAARARELVPGIKVVLVSGYATSRERPDCDAYLQKPFTGDALLATLRPLMKRRST